ncbi:MULTISPECIES: CHC2 zinc finger domain-containing protein [Burkholderia]|uniref:CHC2 zinc finger domain-containing protein n=1 Tax=Burkholderia TaxID=32008 RepID=UPI00163EFB6F|nr:MULTISPECIES: CHC2 zinc finger domain-containing protein [Burkholderia]
MIVETQSIDRAKSTDLISLVEGYGVKLTKQGADYFGLCPFHNENSPSFTVNPAKGFYHCFGCGAHGDPIAFVREFEGIGFRDAVQKLVGNLPADAKPRTKRDIEREERDQEWIPVDVVPESAPAPKDILNRKIDGKWHKLVGKQRWEYRNADGSLIGYVYRFDKPGGGKEVMPQVYCTNQQTGEMEWRWLSFSKPRPLYGLDKLARNPNAQVIVVEGEKACDAAQARFIEAGVPESKLVVVSWPGGGKAVKHADFSPLWGRRVGLWPDADLKTYINKHPKAGELMPFLEQPGTIAMLDIFDAISAECEGVKFFVPPAGVPDGWDLADPFPEGFNLLAHAKAARLAENIREEFRIVEGETTRVVLAPTLDEALGAAHAHECLARLADEVAHGGGAASAGISTGIRRVLFVPYVDAGIQRAAETARATYPEAALSILAAPGDEAEAERVATLQGASIDLPSACGSWRGWGEHYLDLLFSKIEEWTENDAASAVAASQALSRAAERAGRIDDGDPEDDTAPGENPFANNRHFRVLGVDGDTYFFFRKGRRNQVLTIRTSGLSKNALMSLAPLNWWEGIMQGNFDKDAAVGFLMEAAEAAGIYDPTFTRGRGAWWDGDRMVVHLGDRLLVDGTSTELGAIRSEFLYQGGRKIAAPSDEPLSTTDGAWLLEMAKSFRWAKPASAPLLCGWLFLSPLCGALRWRPHAWIAGGAGSGKTTILNEFVRPLIPAGMDVFANGDSTEAGLRQTLRSDARPILIDESESDTEAAAAKMQRILVMIRQSSSDTGAQTYRGTVGGEAQAFQVRSMALLSSIGVALERQQDLERVTVLALRPKREGEATDVQNWPATRTGLNKIAKDKTLSARLFRRSIDMAPITMEAIDVFTEAAATFFGTAREGDQIGALLAGAWCLVNDRLPTQEEALAEIKRYDWGDYQEGKAEEQDDLIATLMGRPIARQGGVRTSVGKLVARAAGYAVEELDILPAIADSELHNFGMKVKDGCLWFHPKNAELLKLMRETKFSSDLRGRLKRIQGASTKDGIRIGEASTSGILIPLSAALSHRDIVDDHTF